ncbi:hypothetical protein [Corynebacterium sp. AOP12-C2-36]|uniref:hypothetical protein n=1 Tax=Corynebacterium sp. AOP12-C2-36 TaxID=3457723 RepID=UPI004033D9CE
MPDTATTDHFVTASDVDKRQDAAQVAIEGFWARPASSGDGAVDLENYVRGLRGRIGWTGSDAELYDVMERATLDADDSDGPGRADAKFELRDALAGKVNSAPVGDDPYLTHRSLSNEDALEKMRRNLDAITDDPSDRHRAEAVAENREIADMLMARVPGSDDARSDAQRFRENVADVSVLATHNPQRAREALDSAGARTPQTPDHVDVRPRVSPTAAAQINHTDLGERLREVEQAQNGTQQDTQAGPGNPDTLDALNDALREVAIENDNYVDDRAPQPAVDRYNDLMDAARDDGTLDAQQRSEVNSMFTGILSGQYDPGEVSSTLDGMRSGGTAEQEGSDEPGWGKIKVDSTHIFRPNQNGGGFQRRLRSGGKKWEKVTELPPSAANIAPSKAAAELGNRCVACGKTLSKGSTTGYGPSCAKKYA